jgi:glycosyltransferase involved in cell wall biosynthesis
MEVVAVIPAYEAATTIGSVVGQVARHLPVVVVDDGSTDGTAQAALAAGARVLPHARNQGKGAALRTGFRHALESGSMAVLTLDADGQHEPACIPAFLEAWRAGKAPLVIGRRDFGQMPLSRRLANVAGTIVFSWAVGRRIADNQSGYRLIAGPLLPRLLESTEPGFEFEVEMITLAIRAGLAIDWVAIPTIYGSQGSHIRPGAHVSNFLRVAWQARRSVGSPIDLDDAPATTARDRRPDGA